VTKIVRARLSSSLVAPLKEYTVDWTINVSARSAGEAAIRARECQVRKTTAATLFNVRRGTHAGLAGILYDVSNEP